MSPSRQQSPPIEPAVPVGAVLATFAETLLSGRRVALFGSSAEDLGERLAEASGRRVHVFDPDAVRAGVTIATRRGETTSVAVAPLDDDLEAHGGAFDAVIIADLPSLGDPEQAVARAVSLLSKRGVLFLASPNPDAADGAPAVSYYDVYDLVAAHFEHISMHGQAPFAGFTVANFAVEGEPAVTIDASLMDGAEEPAWFVAVAAHAPVEVEPYMLVQVPSTSTTAEPDLAASHAELAEAQLQRSLVSAELDKLREREKETSLLARERETAGKRLAARLSEVEDELGRIKTTSQGEVREAHKAVDQLKRRLRAAEGELERRAGKDQQLEAALDAQRMSLDEDLRAQRAELEGVIVATQRKLEAQRLKHDAQLEEALNAVRSELEDAHQEELDAMLERIADLESATDPGVVEEVPAPKSSRPVVDARAHEFQLAELRKALEEARTERDAARRDAADAANKLTGLQQLKDNLAATTLERDNLRGVLESEDDADDEHAREIERLERLLRERGHVVMKLQSDVRESERIGRDLLGRLLQAKAVPSNGASEAGPTEGATRADAAVLRAQLEALATRCGRYEADLQAAAWKITALTATPTEEDASDHEMLEQALRTAHEDLARLRRQLDEQKRTAGE